MNGNFVYTSFSSNIKLAFFCKFFLMRFFYDFQGRIGNEDRINGGSNTGKIDFTKL